ncbi:MAG: hypothetical protein ACOYME_10735, partial [Prochlorotrichaceae cyanobacterium]
MVWLNLPNGIFNLCRRAITIILRLLSSKGKAMIQTLAKTENQYLVKRAVTWKQFKTLQSAFDEIGGVRMV